MQIIPLGGLGEIGKNTTALRVGQDVLVVDAGLSFPDEEMPGIDLVIPDYRFLASGGTLHGIVLTHGHEDHVGSLPFLLQTAAAPVYGTPLDPRARAASGAGVAEHPEDGRGPGGAAPARDRSARSRSSSCT